MKDQALYIQYILACRQRDEKTIQAMLEQGFRPDRRQLLQLAKNVPEIQKILLNEIIIVKLDSGSIAGHVYADYPLRKAEKQSSSRKVLGFYPKESSGFKALYGPGTLKDEVIESRRVSEDYPTLSVALCVPEEALIHLTHWLEKQQKGERDYLIIRDNCIAFTHTALQQAGFVDGLVGKFEPEHVSPLAFRPVKLGLKQYERHVPLITFDSLLVLLRLKDKKDTPSVTLEMADGKIILSKAATIKKEIADHYSLENHVNTFFDAYHDHTFYRTFSRERLLNPSDYAWILKNHSYHTIDQIQFSPYLKGIWHLYRQTQWQYYCQTTLSTSPKQSLWTTDWTTILPDSADLELNLEARDLQRKNQPKSKEKRVDSSKQVFMFEHNKKQQQHKWPIHSKVTSPFKVKALDIRLSPCPFKEADNDENFPVNSALPLLMQDSRNKKDFDRKERSKGIHTMGMGQLGRDTSKALTHAWHLKDHPLMEDRHAFAKSKVIKSERTGEKKPLLGPALTVKNKTIGSSPKKPNSAKNSGWWPSYANPNRPTAFSRSAISTIPTMTSFVGSSKNKSTSKHR